jgi:hypothetical protein
VNAASAQERDRALAMVGEALESIPRVRMRLGDDAAPADAEIWRTGCPPLRIRLRPWAPEGRLEADEVWLLRSGSAAEQQRLRDRGENFIALSGTVRLVADWLAIDRTGLRRVRPATAEKRVDPFSDRNSLIARTLLDHPGRTWGVRELAQAADVAVGTASQVLRTLARIHAVELKRTGRAAQVTLHEPARLLERWFSAYSWDRNVGVAFHAPVGDVPRFLRRLPKLLGERRWALTLHAGAAQVAPHATWERVNAYVDVENLAELIGVGKDLGWDAAADGRVVLMKPYYRTSVWHNLQVPNGLPVVSTLQLALDLWHYPLRGREQAEHLLKFVMGHHVSA